MNGGCGGAVVWVATKLYAQNERILAIESGGRADAGCSLVTYPVAGAGFLGERSPPSYPRASPCEPTGVLIRLLPADLAFLSRRCRPRTSSREIIAAEQAHC